LGSQPQKLHVVSTGLDNSSDSVNCPRQRGMPAK